jgi:hypothetical protein
MSPLEREAGEFSITEGPYLSVLRRLHLTHRDRRPRALVIAAIAWVPFLVGGLVNLAVGRRPPPILWDLSVHARLLVVLPLLVQASRLLQVRCASAVAQLYAGDFGEPAKLDRIVGGALRLRQSRVVELLILVAVVVEGQLLLWHHGGRSGLFSGVTAPGDLSAARIWHDSVALPLTLFFYLSWLWEWALWSYVVIRVSRLSLPLIGTHPDNAGGIGFLDEPLAAFTFFVLAVSATVASAWGAQVLETGAEPHAFVAPFAGILVIFAIIAFGPLCLYVPKLYHVRHRDRRGSRRTRAETACSSSPTSARSTAC